MLEDDDDDDDDDTTNKLISLCCGMSKLCGPILLLNVNVVVNDMCSICCRGFYESCGEV
jgi:hypothetical protein